jgi:flagellar assembly factor FliW
MGEPAREAVAGGGPAPSEPLTVRSGRFGDFQVAADRVITVPDGLIGFPEARRFALLEADRPGSPFRRLLCIDLPDLCFVVCDPVTLFAGYREALPAYEGGEANLGVLAIVTVPRNPYEMTANLLAPLVVDCRSRVGRQIVLDTGRFSTRHPLLPSAGSGAGEGEG